MSMIDNILNLKKKKKKQNHAEFWHKKAIVKNLSIAFTFDF